MNEVVALLADPTWVTWTLFAVGGALALALDLGVLNRGEREMTLRRAMTGCAFWIGLAALFNVLVFWQRGHVAGMEFLAGYVVELCLSVDNVFVFIVVFQFFSVEPRHQHRVLFWGIIGAVIMRTVFVFAGIGLINTFHWIIYVFGAFLVFTGLKLVRSDEAVDVDPERNLLVRLARRILPISERRTDARFVVRQDGRWMVTPLFLVLLVVETTDLMFAMDSIPAVIAITRDEFIVLTSNIFAILGLRSLYFAVAGFMRLLRFLNVGLAVILVFVGIKMLLSHYLHISIQWSLSIVGGVLLITIGASVLFPQREEKSTMQSGDKDSS